MLRMSLVTILVSFSVFSLLWSEDGFAATHVLFEDDFEDGVIDTSKWVWSPGGTGGDVREEDGVLKFILSHPSPYKQVRTSVDLHADWLRLTFRIKPVSIRTNKNIGFYLGETPDDPTDLNGFHWTFNSTISPGRYGIRRVTRAYDEGGGKFLAVGNGFYPERGEAYTTLNVWHDVEIEKIGNTYKFCFDGDLKTTYTDSDPANLPNQLFWTGGHFWNFPRHGETGKLWFDDIKAEVVIPDVVDDQYTYSISPDRVCVPRLWANKSSKKSEICTNYQVTMSLMPSGSGCNLLIQLKSLNDGYTIQGNGGGVFLVIPKRLNPASSRIQSEYLNASMETVAGASLPHFKNVLLEILKKFAPGDVASTSEEVLKVVGVGKLEQIDTKGTVFDSVGGYEALAEDWDAIYHGGKWIKGSVLQLSVPLEVEANTAKSLINEQGVGALFFVKLSCVSANVGIILDNMRFP